MRWLWLALITLQVATCGQTGPLTLPEDRDESRAGTLADAAVPADWR